MTSPQVLPAAHEDGPPPADALFERALAGLAV